MCAVVFAIDVERITTVMLAAILMHGIVIMRNVVIVVIQVAFVIVLSAHMILFIGLPPITGIMTSSATAVVGVVADSTAIGLRGRSSTVTCTIIGTIRVVWLVHTAAFVALQTPRSALRSVGQ